MNPYPTRRANRAFRVLATAVVVLFVAACSNSDDTSAEGDGTVEEASSTTASPTTTDPPLTTTESSTTTIPETTTVPPVTVTTTTSLPHDDEPPEAPTGLVCLGIGGGSMEVLLAFDAPSEPADIETIRVYVDEGSGFQRVAKTTIDGSPASLGSVFDLNTTDPTTWSMGVYPVPNAAEIGIAVTFGDAAGNESGWYPITVTPTGTSCS